MLKVPISKLETGALAPLLPADTPSFQVPILRSDPPGGEDGPKIKTKSYININSTYLET